MTTGERMKARRKELGYSAEYVAEKLGVSPSTIYRYEKGDIEKMPGDILAPISEILRISPAELMGWNDTSSEIYIHNADGTRIPKNEEAPPSLVNDDPELTEILQRAKDDPHIRMLFSVTKDATPEDVEKAIKIIQMLKGE